MTFAHPWLLLGLFLPVLLLLRAIRRRDAGIALPFDHQSHRPRRFLGALLRVSDAVPALVLAAVIMVLSGPQTLQRPRDERVLTNIQICLDVSGSMTAEDRYEMATDAIRRFTLAREGDAFGLTLFGSRQIRWAPLTKDLDVIRRALPFANPAHQPIHMSGTMIAAALDFCRVNMVHEAEEGDRLIILVSDGFSADLGGSASGRKVIDALVAENITMYHVHVGSARIPQEVVDIADGTGGDAFVAKDAKALTRVFRHIDRMRPARFKPGGTVPMDFFPPFAFAGLAAVGLHLLGLAGVRYTPW